MPLNRYHTHEEIVRRKKRVRKNPPAVSATNIAVKQQQHRKEPSGASGSGSIEVGTLGMHLKYEEIVADVTEIVETPTIVLAKKQ